jgi:uncharacterized protein YcbK (DUF882 family)
MCLLVTDSPALSAPSKRFFAVGDGTLKIKSTKNRVRFSGRFRDKRGRYLESALKRINRVFDTSYAKETQRVSLRLLELLSHLRKELGGGWITISSGYRSPTYNTRLRDRGKTVAKASLHLYGMAADLKIQGVDSKKMWRFVREHKLGGAGYYGGPQVHVDVGPARSWTQGTANVRQGKSEHNKRIILVPRFDIYGAGEQLTMRFVRMTAFPIGIKRKQFVLLRQDKAGWKPVLTFAPGLKDSTDAACQMFSSVEQMAKIRWTIPTQIQPGRYRIQATFCNRTWEAMPDQIVSYEFVITD